MEASPLTRQPPPEVFKPKIVQLYESLFKVGSASFPPHARTHARTKTLPRSAQHVSAFAGLRSVS